MKFLLKERFSYLDVVAVLVAVSVYDEGGILLTLIALLIMTMFIVVLELIFLEN